MVCDNLLFGDCQTLPATGVYGDTEASREEEGHTSLRGGRRALAVGCGAP